MGARREAVLDFAYACLRGGAHILLRIFFRIRRVGPRPPLPAGGAIVCANHASWLDPAFVQVMVPRRIGFVMTDLFYRRPWGRWFFRLVRAIPIGAGRAAHEGMQAAEACLRRGGYVGLFPEGRLSRDGTIGRGQRGIAVLARDTGAPVLPLGIAGGFRAWRWNARFPHPADVCVAFGEPLTWAGPQDEDKEPERAFVLRVMDAIARAKARAEA